MPVSFARMPGDCNGTKRRKEGLWQSTVMVHMAAEPAGRSWACKLPQVSALINAGSTMSCPCLTSSFFLSDILNLLFELGNLVSRSLALVSWL